MSDPIQNKQDYEDKLMEYLRHLYNDVGVHDKIPTDALSKTLGADLGGHATIKSFVARGIEERWIEGELTHLAVLAVYLTGMLQGRAYGQRKNHRRLPDEQIRQIASPILEAGKPKSVAIKAVIEYCKQSGQKAPGEKTCYAALKDM